MSPVENAPTTLPEYLAIARRRKWIIILLPIVAAVSAYVVSGTQQSQYEATATVLVNRSNIVSAITNISDPSVGDPTRFLTTQADIARSPGLGDRVVKASGVRGVSTGALLASSSVTPEANADILDVSVRWPDADVAQRLANAYATQFTQYKTELDTRRIQVALATLRARIRQLQARNAAGTAAYTTLVQYQSQLETVGTLLANNTSVLRPAEGATKIRPRPSRNAMFGGLLGLVLGIALAFGAEALDRRIRSEDEIEEILGAPLLGRVPRPPRDANRSRQLAMVDDPTGLAAESVRKLKTSIEFLNLDRKSKSLMITSAVPREGKSTTAANLAIAFARTGQRVALVDLDLRRPSLHSLLLTTLEPGIFDVATGGVPLERALKTVRLPAPLPATRVNGKRHASTEDAALRDVSAPLALIPAGRVPPTHVDAAAEFLESARLGAILDEIQDQFDVVIIDTPPLLAVGDAIALTARVDEVVLVLQAASRRPLVKELARQLQSSRARVLGFVVTGLGEGEAYGGYGYGTYAYDVQAVERPQERV